MLGGGLDKGIAWYSVRRLEIWNCMELPLMPIRHMPSEEHTLQFGSKTSCVGCPLHLAGMSLRASQPCLLVALNGKEGRVHPRGAQGLLAGATNSIHLL